ncbi:MAG: TatD family deoxyribonuclease [Alphaproteobacteria bacterium]|nr:TatD family deoxyribonuclease [Alphaproteobacteria bacterium]
MQFIDSHIHLQDYNAKDTPQVIAQAKDMGFYKLICPAIKQTDWQRILDLSAEYSDMIIPALGLHPWYLSEVPDNWEADISQILKSHPQVLIGECGIDRMKNPDINLQKAIFSIHLDLAREFKRGIIIHSVKADYLIEDFRQSLKDTKFVIHSFSGSLEFLQRVISFGGYISFSPSIFRRSNSADLIKSVPLTRVLLESDGPFQGGLNDVMNLYRKFSELRNLNIDDFGKQLAVNFEEFTNA